MAILEENQDVLSNQIQKTFNFVNLTYAEMNTNRLLLSSLQKDILQVNNTVHSLSKELKLLLHDIIYLPDGCEANAISFLIPSNNKTTCEIIHLDPTT